MALSAVLCKARNPFIKRLYVFTTSTAGKFAMMPIQIERIEPELSLPIEKVDKTEEAKV